MTFHLSMPGEKTSFRKRITIPSRENLYYEILRVIIWNGKGMFHKSYIKGVMKKFVFQMFSINYYQILKISKIEIVCLKD